MLTNSSRVALAVHLAKTCDFRTTSKQLPSNNNNNSSQNSNRTWLDCCRALFVLCSIFLSPFFCFFSFFGQEPFSLSPWAWTGMGMGRVGGDSWPVLSCPLRLTRHRVWASSRICGICARRRRRRRCPAHWAHSSGTLCRIMRCHRRLFCLPFAVWLFGCRGYMVYTCSLQLCSCCLVFFLELLLAVQATGAGIDTKVSTTVQSSGSDSNYVLFALDCSCSNP